MRSNKGITLVETVVYVGLLGFFSVFIASALLYLATLYQRAGAEREVLSNARLIMETVGKEIASAEEIYAPTSAFNTDSGQLSLVTTLGAPAQHPSRFIDFWIDNGLFFVRAEGSGEKMLSAASVRVRRFHLERIAQGLDREAIRVLLHIEYGNARFNASTTLQSAFALRGNY